MESRLSTLATWVRGSNLSGGHNRLSCFRSADTALKPYLTAKLPSFGEYSLETLPYLISPHHQPDLTDCLASGRARLMSVHDLACPLHALFSYNRDKHFLLKIDTRIKSNPLKTEN